MKDKKTLIGFGLIAAIMVGWFIFIQPSKEQKAKQKARQQQILDSTNQANKEKHIKDSLALVEANTPKTVINDTALNGVPDSLRQIVVDSIQNVQRMDSLGVFAAHGAGTREYYTVQTDKYLLTFTNKGGLLYRCQMLGYQSYTSRFKEKKKDTLDMWIPGETAYQTEILTETNQIGTSDLFFETDAPKSTKISGSQEATIKFKAYAGGDKNKYIEYAYTIKGSDFMIGFDVNMVNMDKVVEKNINELPFYWMMTSPSQEHVVTKERENSNIWYSSMEGDVKQLKGGTKKDGRKGEVKFPLKWVSFKQQFFSTALIPSGGFTSSLFTFAVAPGTTDKENKTYAAELAIPFNASPAQNFHMDMYMGPNHWNTIKKYDLGLQKQIDLGYVGFINRWIVIPVFNFFERLGWNYGLIILMLTIIIKLITMPLIYKTFVSSAKMKILKPEVDALNEKFKPEEALAKQQAVMQLYRKAGVSPLSGCIPALLQMPILFAMIAFFPAAFELRQEGLLWAHDLSTYDSILQLPFNIPAYGDHVSLFALLMTITTIFYTRMNSGQMAAQGGIQAQQMKIMMYLMPVVFLVFLNSYSAALSYYYFLSNLISILLMLFIRKFMINEKKLHAQIEENKKKTPKKSKWMSRMEEIQKARTEQLRQQQNQKNKGGNNKGNSPKKK